MPSVCSSPVQFRFVRGDGDARSPCRRRRRGGGAGPARPCLRVSSIEPSSWLPSPRRPSSYSYYSSTTTALKPQTPPPHPALGSSPTSSRRTLPPRSRIRGSGTPRSSGTGPRARRLRGWVRRPRARGGARRSRPACGSAS